MLRQVTTPVNEPLSLADLRDHLRISDTTDDRYLNTLRSVVRQRCERATRRALITQTWDLYLDTWPLWDGMHGGRTFESATLLPSGGFINLPKPPLQSVTSVKYTDMAGVTQTWDPSNYIIDTPAGDFCAKGRLGLGFSKVWPIALPVVNSRVIRMVCGYGDDPEDVPELLRQGMLLDAGTLFDIRGSILAGSRAAAIEIPSTTKDIFLSFRVL